MRIASIASSSSGNCIYVGNDNTHILVDIGVAGRTVEEGLKKLDLSLDDIDAILITHEHIDHVKGLGIIERKKEIPVYASMGTIDALYSMNSLGSYNFDCLKSLRDLSEFQINDITVKPHTIYHDAAEPICYSFAYRGKSTAVVTDTGHFDDALVDDLGHLNFILAEANHDVRMLQMGPYSFQVKQRILSDVGHLSNENCGRFVSRLLNDYFDSIMLGHLSEKNNMASLAYEAVKVEITMSDNKYDGLDFPIYVAPKNDLSNIIDL